MIHYLQRSCFVIRDPEWVCNHAEMFPSRKKNLTLQKFLFQFCRERVLTFVLESQTLRAVLLWGAWAKLSACLSSQESESNLWHWFLHLAGTSKRRQEQFLGQPLLFGSSCKANPMNAAWSGTFIGKCVPVYVNRDYLTAYCAWVICGFKTLDSIPKRTRRREWVLTWSVRC